MTAGKEYMGKKDITGRTFFSDKERFAELMNLYLYQGETVLLPGNLIRREGEYSSYAMAGGKGRDILMEDTKHKIYYGVELETESDYSMPERVMAYDLCEYERQIREIYGKRLAEKSFKTYREKKSRITEKDFLSPVVTVVLYLGEGRWEGRVRLSEMLREAEEVCALPEKRICDYKFGLLEADFLNVESYKTDLKEFFQAMQCRRDRNRLKRLLRSERFQSLKPETELAVAVHLNMKGLARKIEREGLPMCKAFDDLMREERQSGRREGKREGKKEERFGIIVRMKKEGLEEAQIIRLTKCTKEEYARAALKCQKA